MPRPQSVRRKTRRENRDAKKNPYNGENSCAMRFNHPRQRHNDKPATRGFIVDAPPCEPAGLSSPNDEEQYAPALQRKDTVDMKPEHSGRSPSDRTMNGASVATKDHQGNTPSSAGPPISEHSTSRPYIRRPYIPRLWNSMPASPGLYTARPSNPRPGNANPRSFTPRPDGNANTRPFTPRPFAPMPFTPRPFIPGPSSSGPSTPVPSIPGPFTSMPQQPVGQATENHNREEGATKQRPSATSSQRGDSEISANLASGLESSISEPTTSKSKIFFSSRNTAPQHHRKPIALEALIKDDAFTLPKPWTEIPGNLPLFRTTTDDSSGEKTPWSSTQNPRQEDEPPYAEDELESFDPKLNHDEITRFGHIWRVEPTSSPTQPSGVPLPPRPTPLHQQNKHGERYFVISHASYSGVPDTLNLPNGIHWEEHYYRMISAIKRAMETFPTNLYEVMVLVVRDLGWGILRFCAWKREVEEDMGQPDITWEVTIYLEDEGRFKILIGPDGTYNSLREALEQAAKKFINICITNPTYFVVAQSIFTPDNVRRTRLQEATGTETATPDTPRRQTIDRGLPQRDHHQGIAQPEGDNSSARGANSSARGANSSARGANSSARGANRSARGANSSARGANSSARGANSSARGANSSARGANSSARGAHSSARGANSSARGANSSARGANSSARGANSSARGANSSPYGQGSIVYPCIPVAVYWPFQGTPIYIFRQLNG